MVTSWQKVPGTGNESGDVKLSAKAAALFGNNYLKRAGLGIRFAAQEKLAAARLLVITPQFGFDAAAAAVWGWANTNAAGEGG